MIKRNIEQISNRERAMRRTAIVVGAAGLFLSAMAWAAPRESALGRYARLPPPTYDRFDQGWEDRAALEFEIVNHTQLPLLRAGLKDGNPYVRAIAARALGYRADRVSAETLAGLAEKDPEYGVRIRAVEALAFLKMKPEVVERAKKDPDAGVQWTAQTVEGVLTGEVDYAAQARRAYAEGIRREAMGSARVGRKAPDFAALTVDREPFRLSQALRRRKPIALYFAAFDG